MRLLKFNDSMTGHMKEGKRFISRQKDHKFSESRSRWIDIKTESRRDRNTGR